MRATLVLGALYLASTLSAAYLWTRLDAQQQHAAHLQARLHELEQQRATIPSPFRRSNVATADSPPPRTAPAANPAEPPAAPPPLIAPVNEAATSTERPAGRLGFARRNQELLQDPQYREAFLTQQRHVLARMHPDLRAALGLQPAEAERLLDMLAEHQAETMAMRPPFRPDMRPDEMAIQDWRRQMEERHHEQEAEIAAVLGEHRLQEWRDYQSSLGARTQLRELRLTLAESGIPLRQDQVEPLVQAVAAELQRRAGAGHQSLQRRAPSRGGAMQGAALTQDLDAVAEANRQLVEQARSILTTEQLRYFEDMLRNELQLQRATQQMLSVAQPAAREGGAVVAGDRR